MKYLKKYPLLTMFAVLFIAVNIGGLVGRFNSASDAEKELKAHHVSCICAGKRKSSNGYTFKYA